MNSLPPEIQRQFGMNDKFPEWCRDSYKAAIDLYKHLTTLSTGLILILSGFHEKFAGKGEWTALLGVVLVSLAITILTSILCATRLAEMLAGAQDEKKAKRTRFFANVTWLAFVIAIVALVVYAFKNIF